MQPDPIIEELHAFRKEYAARFDCDEGGMFRDLQARQASTGCRNVYLPAISLLTCKVRDKRGQEPQPANCRHSGPKGKEFPIQEWLERVNATYVHCAMDKMVQWNDLRPT